MSGRYPVYSPVGEYTPLHLAVGLTTTFLSGVGRCVALTQTLGANVVAGIVNTVALSSVKGIYQGQILNFAESGGTPVEDVRVLTVDPVGRTFQALFVNAYSSGASINITSRNASRLGGIVVNQPGSGVTIQLSNGHPNLQPNPTTSDFGTIGNPQPAAVGLIDYQAYCEFGLFVSVNGGTIGDYTLLYRDVMV